MKSFYKKLKDTLFNTQLTSSFDTYNNESNTVFNLSNFTGIKTEISKTVSPNFQISHISNIGPDFESRQTYGTFCFNNLLLQTSIDQDKIFRIRGTHMFNNFYTKFHTVIGRSKDIFTQIEIDLRNRYNNLCIKMIQPAIKGASCVYVGNYMQQLGIFSIGGECIKADEYLGLSFVGRYEGIGHVSTISLQHFNTLSIDYYKTVTSKNKKSALFEYGMHFSTNREKQMSYGVGVRVHSKRGEIIGSLDNKKVLSLVYNDKLSEGLSLNLNCRVGKNVFDYGYGFTYEF
ncbi:mitochondrial translocase (TOMM40L) [Vairimorpha necatrix]|uniref:Mitochondrial translocase (TOMM40L) n=1 Tax=Vairimorpha necatrix TaxID=6039 RepID=A0AAX4JCF1_9MICR